MDFHDGRAEQNASAQVQEHVAANCAHCMENLSWLERSSDTMREAARVQVPHALVDRLQALYTERFRMPVRPSVLARLRFDGRSHTAIAGARGGGREAFKLNYGTEEHDIDIWAEPAGEGAWYLIGQILPREGDEVFHPQRIVLTPESGEEIAATPELPEFHLPSVPSGIYQAAIRLNESDILIPDFEIG